MDTYSKIKYTQLKYKTKTKCISVPKEALLNPICINKYKHPLPNRELNFNSNSMNNNNIYNTNNLKVQLLNYKYNNSTEQPSNINYNLTNNIYSNMYNNNLNTNSLTINRLNKTTPHYYSNKLKDKILNNLKDSFQVDKIKKKKALYVNVNFNVNQNYSIPNYSNKNNRSLSVQNNFENKNDVNKNINNKITTNNDLNLNNINNNYFESYYDINKNETIKPIYNNDKQILSRNKNYIYTNPNQNKKNNLAYKRNQSSTKIFNYKSLDIPIKEPININNKINNKYINTNISTNIKKINNQNINAENIIVTELNNFKNKLNNKDNGSQIKYLLYNLELKMQKLLRENKTESKGKNYNIVRKIFEEGINTMNLSQIEKNFLKLMMVKYHDIVYAFSQKNKSLKQSNENLQNINFSLDKKFIELDKKYKLILKENEEMKKESHINLKSNVKKINNKIIIKEIADNNNDIEHKKNNFNEINNNIYKSIKDMDFITNSIQKDEDDKKEINNEKNERNNLEKSIKNINFIKKN